MAKRPVFIAGDTRDNLVRVDELDFEWYAGFSISQKQLSIKSLHSAFTEKYSNKKILEISSKSELELGKQLSSFNLEIKLLCGQNASVESLYQSSKVFENGKSYTDIRYKSSLEAKRDVRLKSSGDVIAFNHQGEIWDKEPKTAFYNWLYLNVLNKNAELKEAILEYDAFTDIEFNPKKSFNCQANAAALYVALRRQNLLKADEEIPKQREFLALISSLNGEQSDMDLFDSQS